MGKLFTYRNTWPFLDTKEGTVVKIKDEVYLAIFISNSKQAEAIQTLEEGWLYIIAPDVKAHGHWEAWEFGNFIRRVGISPNRCAVAVQDKALYNNICAEGWDGIDKTRSFTVIMP